MKHPSPLRFLLAAAMIAALVFLTKSAAPHPSPTPPGAFSFAALGDAPYYFHEDFQFRILMRELDATDLPFTIHIGDIFWRPCSDAMYQKVKQRFDHLRAPVIYTPGDNEWTDCWEQGSGGYHPLERLARIRQIFYGGRPRMAVERQQRLVENARWQYDGVTFVTVDLVGSGNALDPFPGRTPADDAAAAERTNADIEWMRAAFADRNARAVVLAFHASPSLENPPGRRNPFESFLAALEEEVARFKKPVLLIHGDDHKYTVDSPVISRHALPNFTRLEVPGSPDVGWVRVFVKPGTTTTFAFEKHVVPRWKYW